MPNLEDLRLSNIGSHGKIWDEKLRVPFYSKNLKNLIEDDYRNHTESLFSSSTARALTKLKHLEILSCPALVEIFVQQEKVSMLDFHIESNKYILIHLLRVYVDMLLMVGYIPKLGDTVYQWHEWFAINMEQPARSKFFSQAK